MVEKIVQYSSNVVAIVRYIRWGKRVNETITGRTSPVHFCKKGVKSHLIALWIILGLCIGCAAGAAVGYSYRKNNQEKKIGRTEEYAKNLLEEAQRRAEDKKKETILEAKEEVIRLKNELDREIRERRNEVQRSERRVQQREESVDRKMDNLEAREEGMIRQQEEIERIKTETVGMYDKQQEELQRIAQMTLDEARDVVMNRVQKDAYHDAAALVRDIEQKAKEEADKKARNIIALAIQRCASDHVAESTVSVVSLPNEDMKGRIIGREGRNIRTPVSYTHLDVYKRQVLR